MVWNTDWLPLSALPGIPSLLRVLAADGLYRLPLVGGSCATQGCSSTLEQLASNDCLMWKLKERWRKNEIYYKGFELTPWTQFKAPLTNHPRSRVPRKSEWHDRCRVCVEILLLPSLSYR